MAELSTTFPQRLPRAALLVAVLAGGLSAAAGEYILRRPLDRNERILLAVATAAAIIGASWVIRALPRLAKGLVFRTPAARFLAPRYHYNFRPAQLAYFVALLDDVQDVPGSIVEVGCFAGATSIFLSEHLRDLGRPRQYVAIDTFGGFLPDDVHHEVTARGKAADVTTFATGFGSNNRTWVERSVRLAGHANVDVVQGDAGALDYAPYGPIAFALIDVDLYQPVAKALARIAPLMAPGGRIVVDDCRPGHAYDGALEAYTTFCAATGRTPTILHQKLGLLRF